MATIEATQNFPVPGKREFILVSWTDLNTTDVDGTPFTLAEFRDRSVQVTGTFGTGGSIKIEGSNDGVNYSTLTDPQGNDLVFNASKVNKLEAISELALYVRPYVTAGDGTTSLTVTLIAGK